MAESELIQQLTDETFDEAIASGVVLVDFFAEWCGPCRMLSPILADLASKLEGQARIAKLDIDAAQRVTTNFQVTSVPTLVLFKDGQEVDRVVGLRDAESLEKMINAAVV